MTTEIEKRKDTPADMIRLAVEGGADLEKIERLLDIQMKWEKNEAKKAYHEAMSKFKENPPKIDKDKTVKYKDVKYCHASLANVVEKITIELSKHGLSASWKTSQNGQIIVTCRITHVLGHSEETTLSAPADGSGSKNSIQAIGSTLTYLQRYTLLSALGLATYDHDDDARSVEVKFLDGTQLSTVIDYMAVLKVDEEKFLEYLGAPTLDEIPASLYNKAISALKAKEKKA